MQIQRCLALFLCCAIASACASSATPDEEGLIDAASEDGAAHEDDVGEQQTPDAEGGQAGDDGAELDDSAAGDGMDGPDGGDEPEVTPGEGVRCEAELDAVPSLGFGSRSVLVRGDVAYMGGGLGLELYLASELGSAGDAALPFWWLSLPGPVLDMATDGDLLAVASGPAGVALLDVAADQPVHRAVVHASASAVSAALHGHWLAVASSDGMLSLFDVSDPTLPLWTATIKLPGPAKDVVLADGVAWAALGSSGLAAVNWSDPTAPFVVSTAAVSGELVRATVVGQYLYGVARYSGLQIFDIAAALEPEFVGGYSEANNTFIPQSVVIDEARKVAICAGNYHQVLRTVDVSDPTAPKLVGVSALTGGAIGSVDVALWGNRAFTSGQRFRVWDLADLAAPEVMPAERPNGVEGAVDGVWHQGKLYVAAQGQGLMVMDDGQGGAPELLATVPFDLPVLAVAAEGEIAFVGLDATYPMILRGELAVVDMSNAAAPQTLLRLPHAGRPSQVVTANSAVYVAAGQLFVFDASDPAATFQTAPELQAAENSARGLAVEGALLAVANTYTNVRLYDVSNPFAPKPGAVIETPGTAQSVALEGSRLAIADGAAGVQIYDVSDPAAPIWRSTVRVPTPANRVGLVQDTLWTLEHDFLRAFSVAQMALPVPLYAVATPSGQATSLWATGGAAWLTDGAVPLSRVSIDCEEQVLQGGAPVLGAGDPGKMRWLNLVPDSAEMRLDASGQELGTIGYGAAMWSEQVQKGAVVKWSPEPTGAPSLQHPAPGGPAIVVAAGSGKAARAVVAPGQALPASGVAVRLIHAAAEHGPAVASLVRSGEVEPLGAVPFGGAGPSLGLPSGLGWQLAVASAGYSQIFPLPPLPSGVAVDLVLASAPEGDLFVVVLASDGPAIQLGSVDRAAKWRFVNLAEVPLTAELEGEPHAGLVSVAPTESSGLALLWPSTKRIVFRASDTGEIVHTIAALPLDRGQQLTTVVFPLGSSLAHTTSEDFSGQSTGDHTELKLVHGAADLGTVNLALFRYDDNWDKNPTQYPFAEGLAPGQWTPVKIASTATYAIGVDADLDGTFERKFNVGYFPNYGQNLILGRRIDGELSVGVHPPVESPVYWRYADEEIARVSVVNLTGRPGLIPQVSTNYDADYPNYLSNGQQSGDHQLIAGDHTVALFEESSGKAWSWTGSLEAQREYSVVFWENANGEVEVMALDDTLPNPPAGRLVHLAPTLGPVAWRPQGAKAFSVAVEPLGVSAFAPLKVGGSTALEIDLDADGKVDLTYSAEYPSIMSATNIYLTHDGNWPVIYLQNDSSTLAPSFANELQALIRVVYLPTSQSQAQLWIDGELATTVWAKSSNGVEPPSYGGSTTYAPLEGGAHALSVKVGGEELLMDADLPGGSHHTLVVAGGEGAPKLWLLDDDEALGDAEHAVVVTSALPEDVAVGVYSYASVDGAPDLVAADLPGGSSSEPVPVPAPSAAFGLDRDGDGQIDWKTLMGGAPGLTRVFVTAGADKPLLLPVSSIGYSFLGGKEL
jgi:hypothetical protein